MAESPISSVGEVAREWVYLMAGVGVLTYQKVQVARRELVEKLDRGRPDEIAAE